MEVGGVSVIFKLLWRKCGVCFGHLLLYPLTLQNAVV